MGNSDRFKELRERAEKRKQEREAWLKSWHPCAAGCGEETIQEYCEYCASLFANRRIQSGGPWKGQPPHKVMPPSIGQSGQIGPIGPAGPPGPPGDLTQVMETLRNIQKRLDDIEKRISGQCSCGEPALMSDYLCRKCREELDRR